MVLMPKALIIRKANDLIEARYKLTLIQQRLILYLNAQVKAWDKDFTEYSISVTDFCEFLDIDPSNMYSQFTQISKELISKTLTISKDNQTIITAWLSAAIYDADKGLIRLEFSPKLRDFLLDLNEKYTKYSFDDVKRLKSTYSYRIYELLKQYYNRKIKERTLSVDELKEMFQIKDIYANYADFKRKVILVAQNELFEKADICFDFEEIKKSRKVIQIRFVIKRNDKNIAPFTGEISPNILEDITSEDVSQSLQGAIVQDNELFQSEGAAPLLSFISEPLTPQQQTAIYSAAGGDMEKIKRRYEIVKTKPNIRDLVGYMISILPLPDSEFESPVASSADSPAYVTPKKNRFVNFEQREIDFKKIEQMELELLKERLKEIDSTEDSSVDVSRESVSPSS